MFWGEPVSAFHGWMGYSANVWLRYFESLASEDQPPQLRFVTVLSGCRSSRSMLLVAWRCLTWWATGSQCRCFVLFRALILILVLRLPVLPLRRRLLLLRPHLLQWMLQWRTFRSQSSLCSGVAGGFAWTAKKPAAGRATRTTPRSSGVAITGATTAGRYGRRSADRCFWVQLSCFPARYRVFCRVLALADYRRQPEVALSIALRLLSRLCRVCCMPQLQEKNCVPAYCCCFARF